MNKGPTQLTASESNVDNDMNDLYRHKLSMIAGANNQVCLVSNKRANNKIAAKGEKQLHPIEELKTEEDKKQFIKRKLEAVSIFSLVYSLKMLVHSTSKSIPEPSHTSRSKSNRHTKRSREEREDRLLNSNTDKTNYNNSTS